MDCPNCGTYNPEDRETCWRCDRPLPQPTQKRSRNRQQSAQRWLYVIVGLFLVWTVLQMCGVRLPFGPQAEVPPEGWAPQFQAAPVAYSPQVLSIAHTA